MSEIDDGLFDDIAEDGWDSRSPYDRARGCWCPRDGGEAIDCPVHGGEDEDEEESD